MGALTLIVIILVIIIFCNRKSQIRRQNRRRNRENPLSVYFRAEGNENYPQVYTGDGFEPYVPGNEAMEPPPPYNTTSVGDMRQTLPTLTISLTYPAQTGYVPDQPPPAYEIAIRPIPSGSRARSNSIDRRLHCVNIMGEKPPEYEELARPVSPKTLPYYGTQNDQRSETETGGSCHRPQLGVSNSQEEIPQYQNRAVESGSRPVVVRSTVDDDDTQTPEARTQTRRQRRRRRRSRESGQFDREIVQYPTQSEV